MFENYYWHVYKTKKDWFISHKLYRKTKNGNIYFGSIEEYLNDSCYINLHLNKKLKWCGTDDTLEIAKLKAITKAEELYRQSKK